VAPVKRSAMDAMGMSSQLKEGQVHAYKVPTDKVTSWLKVVSTDKEKAKIEGKKPVTYAQAVECGIRRAMPNSVNLEREGGKKLKGIMLGEDNAGIESVPASTTQAKTPVGAACSVLQELPKSWDVSLTAFNAKQELHSIREWLGRLRGEVDAGIVRLEMVLKNLNVSGSGQGSGTAGRISKSKKFFKPQKRYCTLNRERGESVCRARRSTSGIDGGVR
jgi:hypothetical protein